MQPSEKSNHIGCSITLRSCCDTLASGVSMSQDTAPSYTELFIFKLTVLHIDIQEHLSRVWVNSKMRWSEFVKLPWSIFGQQPWTNKVKSLITCNSGPNSDGKKCPSRFCSQLQEIILVIQQSNSVTKHHQMSHSAPLVSQLFFFLMFFFF